MKIKDFVWGPIGKTTVTFALMVIALMINFREPTDFQNGLFNHWLGRLFLIIGLFSVLQSGVQWWRETTSARRLRNNFEKIQHNVLHLIADLSGLAGREYDAWMIDLYLYKSTLGASNKWPFFRKSVLERQLTVSLTDVRNVPLTVNTKHELFGESFIQRRSCLWWDTNIAHTQIEEANMACGVDASVNSVLKNIYGVIHVSPVVDRVGKACRGILVVHTNRDSETATKGLGVLAQSEGQRFVARTCLNIHDLLDGK